MFWCLDLNIGDLRTTYEMWCSQEGSDNNIHTPDMEIEMFYIKILNIHNSEWNLLNME